MMANASDVPYKKRLPDGFDIPFKDDPTQKIIQYPDGSWDRIITIDGKTTRQSHHASGSYEEKRSDGTHVMFAANNTIMYSKGGITMSIDNHGDIKIKGHARINVDTDAHIAVGKNASIAVGGAADVYASGHIKLAATDIAIQSTGGSIVFNSARDIELRADKGRITGHSSGVTTFTTDSGDFHVDSAGKVQMNSKMDTDIKSGAKLNTTSKDATNITSQDALNTNSQTDTTINTKAKTEIKSQKATNIHGFDDGVNVAGGQVAATSAAFLPG